MEENKNLMDSQNSTSVRYGISSSNLSFGLSYTKTNKLITALYMVTDIIEREEPMRAKLRTLGTEILSDSYLAPSALGHIGHRLIVKIVEALSFLEIASTLKIISEMNSNILRSEFIKLSKSVEDLMAKSAIFDPRASIEEFFKDELPAPGQQKFLVNKSLHKAVTGHSKLTRIGVQKGSTLMKALSDKTASMSDRKKGFDVLKNERRGEIIKIITNYQELYPNLGGATITDIKMKGQGVLANCGEKTLQRELVAMVADGVLFKTGSKRWSRYSMPGGGEVA